MGYWQNRKGLYNLYEMYKYPEAERIPASKVREQLSNVLNKVAVRGDRILIERHGSPVAAVISIEDLEFFEALEDQNDLRLAEEALNEAGESIPLEEVKKELGM
jgi:prevent-host-death family protein